MNKNKNTDKHSYTRTFDRNMKLSIRADVPDTVVF